ncbi:MAG: hypothetical protein JXR91_01220 [Deltaproteobacteria bacterium]|nr:hypothetical protein [Deltaproteobacteria bacterium]
MRQQYSNVKQGYAHLKSIVINMAIRGIIMRKKLSIFSLLISCFLAAPALFAQDDDFDANFVAPRAKVAPGLGWDPTDLAIKTYGVNPIGLTGGDDEDGEKNNFYYTGFLRAPLNMGIGTNQTLNGDGMGGKKLHAPPVIPDSSYLDWRYTNLHGGPWAEIRFTYGNTKVNGNVTLATYNMTAGGYEKLAAQLGISEGFVSLALPGLFNGRGGVVANVGIFSARYGAAGRYDAGIYDTYLFGATKVAGEQVRLYFDVAPKVTLHFEQGFGGKIEVAPFMPYELKDEGGAIVTNSDTGANVPNPLGDAPWAPYGGSDWEQGDTFLHHEHLGVSIDDKLFIGAHLMHAFSVDSDSFNPQYGSKLNAHIINVGMDIRLRDFFFGDAYLGYAHTDLENPLRLGGALEALHSTDGWAWSQNFFKPGSIDPSGGSASMTATDGSATGTIDSISFEYDLSIAKLLWHPKEFWGQDKDVLISVFGMMNFINSDSPLFSAATKKLKWGASAQWIPIKWFGVGARWDSVNPDMDNNKLSFNTLSANLLFQTDFITHETFTIQYSKYFNGSDVMPGYPWNADGANGAMRPDDHVITMGASMWW